MRQVGDTGVLPLEGLAGLIAALRAEGRRVIAPRVRDDAIVYDEIASVDDLPRGVTELQEAGRYRLAARDDDALFGFTVGPHSWKRYLFPPRSLLFRAERTADGFTTEAPAPDPRPLAFLGVRACDVRAIAIQDRVFVGGEHADPTYAAARSAAFVVAVQCGDAAPTCFCTSMGSGPRAEDGFDLALTELDAGAPPGPAGHRFLLQIGSERGAALVERLADRPDEASSGTPAASAGRAVAPATATDHDAARAATEHAVSRMTRSLDAANVRDVLLADPEHPRWADVASRCVSCANCTMVCPTCFCSTVTDTTDLTGDHAERWREWDSCFTLAHSYVHGGSVRASTRSRYRQWLTHKLATWHDQFGESGCTGCGRCITWCPPGIDLTQEVAALAARRP